MTDSPFTTLRVSADGAVGHLVLDRPERLNALSRTTLAELAGAAAWFDERREVKAVVVRGEGRAFSAGFDLDDFRSRPADGTPDDGAELGREMADAVTGMRAVTVAAIHGHCVGGGLVLAGSCDLRIAARGARFSIPEVDLGIPLAWGGIPRLVRELGPAITKELVLTCRPFGADEAAALRFVNRVVDDDAVVAAAEELAAELATKSAFTLTSTKRHVNAVAEESGSTAQSFRDAEILAAALRDPESRAAGAAYLERRTRRGETRR
ncbi:MAG TPA: enoyl-CoA hydratase/isomerase family protein [Acidimicrobiales bacterium]|nr:enoyl-CoA hydratase/isomerase family protein [Acidimicrobiales bacterium]